MQCGKFPAITTRTTVSLMTSPYYSIRTLSAVEGMKSVRFVCLCISALTAEPFELRTWNLKWVSEVMPFVGQEYWRGGHDAGGNFIPVPMECRFASPQYLALIISSAKWWPNGMVYSDVVWKKLKTWNKISRGKVAKLRNFQGTVLDLKVAKLRYFQVVVSDFKSCEVAILPRDSLKFESCEVAKLSGAVSDFESCKVAKLSEGSRILKVAKLRNFQRGLGF